MLGRFARLPRFRRVITGMLLALLASGVVSADESTPVQTELAVEAAPVVTFPVGSSREYFAPGYGAAITGTWLPSGSWGAGFGVDAVALPLRTPSTIRLLAAYAGPVYRMALGRRVSLAATGRVGGYHWAPREWDAHDANGGGMLAGVGAGAAFRLAGSLSALVDVSYGYYAKLAHTALVRLAVRLDSRGLRPLRSGVELEDIELRPVFPVLYAYYDDRAIGSVTLRNTGDRPVENLRVRFFVERFMDDPTELDAPIELDPGEAATVDLYATFTEDMLGVTEGTQVSARVLLGGESAGERVAAERSAVLPVYDRNALTWDDDRKIGSFITAKDPQVLSYARNVVTWFAEVKCAAVDENLQKALALFEALRASGIQYEVDPTTPFARLSEDESAVDYLQFPRQTLAYTSGDCDDLTALYCALLESVGVETAFITVPGHIFAAFALASPPDRARAALSDPDSLIVDGGRAWVPVETTLVDGSFAESWDAGVRVWHEHDRAGAADLYRTREAWSAYPSVGFAEGGVETGLPDRADLIITIGEGIDAHVRRQLAPRVAALEADLASAADARSAVRVRNRLAVTYARYGLYDEAEEHLREIVAVAEHGPALVNLANIHLIRGEHARAGALYDRALALDPQSGAALVGLVRCARESGEDERAQKALTQLEDVAPELASGYAGGGADDDTRATGIPATVALVWEEAER